MQRTIRTASGPAWVVILGVLLFAGGCSPPGPAPSAEASLDEEVIRHNILGTAYLGQQKWAEAEAAFDSALERSPGEPLLLNNKAVALLQQGRIDEAEGLLNEALESDPACAHAHYNLGNVLKNRGDFEPAVLHFEAVEAFDPGDVMVHYNLGMVYSRIGRVEQAEAQYRMALELDPTHVSSLYALGRLLLQGGDQEQGVELITRSQEIRARSGLDEAVGSQYGEQGSYAMGADYPGDALEAPRAVSVVFEVRSPVQLPVSGLRSQTIVPGPEGSDPVLWVVDGEGALRALGDAGLGAPIAADRPFRAVAAGDLDDDGSVEIVGLSVGATELGVVAYAADGSSRELATPMPLSAPVEEASMTLLDRDHDGDLDLFFCWNDRDGSACAIGTNEGDGSFSLRPGSEHGLTPSGGTRGGDLTVAFSDIDNDRDIDLLLARRGRLDVFINQRDDSFLETSAEVGLADAVPDASGSMEVADINKDGRMDLVVGTTTGARLLVNESGRFAPGLAFESAVHEDRRVVVFDHDNDGFLDLAMTGESGVMLHRNLGAGRWDLEGRSLGDPEGGPLAPLTVLDADHDGDLDVVALGAEATPVLTWLVATSDNPNRFVRIVSRGVGDNRAGIGAKVEILAGALRQKFEITRPLPLHVGLGTRDRIETVRYVWPSGVLQDEIDLPADDRIEVAQLDRKGTSCPLLYAWRDGEWRFVTDFLGGAAIGYLHAPGRYSVPDTDEYIKIEGGLSAADDGSLRVRVNNQLQEVIWFDRFELVIVEHPAGTEVFPDERLMPGPPFAGWGLFASDDLRPVRRAVSVESGEDVTSLLSERDRRYVDDFEKLRFKGYATDHTLELDLGEEIPGDRRLVLLLDGWIDYADSSANLAAHQAGVGLVPPVLTVSDGEGGWVETEHQMGFPAGLPKTMSVDLTGLFPADDRRIRIATNMRIYWDRARVMVGGEGIELDVRRLPAEIARLEFGGYPRPASPDGKAPFGYDPRSVSAHSPWTVHVGHYTGFGDVRETLSAIDDRLVTTRSGDQIELRFADPGEPGAGRTRTFLLFADGFGKDMDPNSAANLHVGPVPFHGMPVYPYEDGVVPPVAEGPSRPSRMVFDSGDAAPGAVSPLVTRSRESGGS